MSPMANEGSRWSLVGITLPEYVSLSKPKFSWSIHRVDIHRVDIYRVGIHRVDIHRVFASLELSQGMGGALWRSLVCTP